jgi:two-component system, NarL family, sensor kinase
LIAFRKPPRVPSDPRTSGTPVAAFAGVALLFTVALAALSGVLARSVGNAEASRSLENLALVTAAAVVPTLDEPSATSGRGAARPTGATALAKAGPLVRIKVWDASGRVVWSDEPRLVGGVFPLGTAKQRALRDGAVGSAVPDGESPGNRYERGMGPLREAYVGVRDADGTPLLVDVFARDDDATIAAWQVWLHFAPATLAAMLLLQLVAVPYLWRLARRLRAAQEAEEGLRQAATQAAETERRRIAGELHDHVVQDLTGLAYELDAARLRGGPRARDDVQLLAGTAAGLRRSIGDLRAVLASLMRPRPPSDGLWRALNGLGEPLRAAGIRVRVRTSEPEDVPPPVAALLYRCAEEAFRNVAAHSRASTVDVTVQVDKDHVTMSVDDDGRGFDAGRLEERGAAGHLGLRALGELIRGSGGSLAASSAPGQGTRLEIRVPLTRRLAIVGGLP